jgi:hypothetical protein
LKSQTFYKLVVIFRFLLSDVIYSSGKTERNRNLSFFIFSVFMPFLTSLLCSSLLSFSLFTCLFLLFILLTF